MQSWREHDSVLGMDEFEFISKMFMYEYGNFSSYKVIGMGEYGNFGWI